LYDLVKDPYQIRNVAGGPAYEKDRKTLAAQLMKILTNAGDPRVSGGGRTFEQSPFTNPSPQEQQRRAH